MRRLEKYKIKSCGSKVEADVKDTSFGDGCSQAQAAGIAGAIGVCLSALRFGCPCLTI